MQTFIYRAGVSAAERRYCLARKESDPELNSRPLRQVGVLVVGLDGAQGHRCVGGGQPGVMGDDDDRAAAGRRGEQFADCPGAGVVPTLPSR
jgi:hypothetical protein